jgi:hypothetical protein
MHKEFCFGNLKGKDHCGDFNIDGNVLLQQDVNKQGLKM